MLDTTFYMPETLAEFVSRVMRENRLSTFDVERASRKQISQSHVSRIQNAIVTSPSARKLKGLAKGLGVPEHELFAVARGFAANTVIANERLASIDRDYAALPRTLRSRADYLIEIVEREIRLMASSAGIPVAPFAPSTIRQPITTTQAKTRRAR